MAPNRFVAPIRKNGAGSSFSFSSNSSLGAQVNQDTTKATPPAVPEIKQSSQGFSVPTKGLPKALNSSRTSTSKRNLESTSDDRPAEPVAKRFNMETPITTSESTTIKVEVIEDNNDKENVEPKPSKTSKAPKDIPKRPTKSLTDEEYENIFKAVLARFPPDEPSDLPENTTTGDAASKSSKVLKKTAVEESEDMFEFSQSDLDSEDETLNTTVIPNNKIASKDLDNTDPGPNSANSAIASISSVSHIENNCSQDQIVPPSPSVTYLCHMSQPIQSEDTSEGQSLACNENTGGSSQAEQQSSKGPLNIKTEILSTPCNSQITSTPLTTPQKLDSTIKLSLSQEPNFSPIIHQRQTTSSDCNLSSPLTQLPKTPSSNQIINVSVLKQPLEISTCNHSKSESESMQHDRVETPRGTPVRAPAILRTSESSQHLKTPVKTSDVVDTPQSSQGPKTPLRTTTAIHNPQSGQGSKTPTPVRKQTIAGTPQPSQDPKTPTTVRKPTIAGTPQPSQDPKTPTTVRKPTIPGTPQSSQDPKTPNTRDANHSVTSTPNSSQQFMEDIQFTPPPSKSTARDRLKWIQKKRLQGLWVQCDKETCGKWRYLPNCHDPSTLPGKWFCSMHPDAEYNHCNAPEKRESLRVEEDMIFNKYSPGSLVWARVPGYPWWPAMVDDDPDLEIFYWLNLFSDIPNWYHVVFFDDDRRSSCVRAWIPVERLMNLEDLDDETIQSDGYQERVTEAYKKACSAKNLAIDDRLAKHSFAACYKGPIGGPSKTLYEGPIGYRKAVL